MLAAFFDPLEGWSEPERVGLLDPYDNPPALEVASDPAGNITAAWVSNGAGLRVARYEPAAGGWTSIDEVLVPAGQGAPHSLDVSTDDADGVLITWSQGMAVRAVRFACDHASTP